MWLSINTFGQFSCECGSICIDNELQKLRENMSVLGKKIRVENIAELKVQKKVFSLVITEQFLSKNGY